MPQSLAKILVDTVFSTSIGASQIEDVRHCIAEQEQHHRKLTLQDEFRLLLRRYEVAYNERYVWD